MQKQQMSEANISKHKAQLTQEFLRKIEQVLGSPLPDYIRFYLDREDLEREAEPRLKAIQADYTLLSEILSRHESLIRHRWGKKKGEQRKKTLRDAWPDINVYHRPDIRRYRQDTTANRRKHTDEAYPAYCLPDVNLEDLSRGASLLRFLNSRGRHHPYQFFAMDWDSFQLGTSSGVIQGFGPEQINQFWMDLDTDDWSEFGQIGSGPTIERYPIAAKSIEVLEIQSKILSFLVNCCRKILPDLQLDMEILGLLSIEPEPPAIPIEPKGEGNYPSTLDLSLEWPYLVPTQPDLSQLQKVIKARLVEARDHAFAMREDPAYYADRALEWSEHTSDNLKDYNGRPLERPNPRKYWDEMMGTIMNEIYYPLFMWGVVDRELSAIMDLADDPESQQERARRLTTVLDVGPSTVTRNNISRFFPPSPPWRDRFYLAEFPSGETKITHRKDMSDSDYFWWLQDRAAQVRHGGSNQEVPASLIAAELNRVSQTDPNVRPKVTGLVARYIADYALFNEVRDTMIRLDPYRDTLYDREGDIYEKKMLAQEAVSWMQEFMQPFVAFMRAASVAYSQGGNYIKIGSLGNPKGGRFRYPSDKRRTAENVRAMREAEANLDAFWDAWDSGLARKMSPENYAVLQDAMPAKSELHRTPEWVEPEPRKAAASALAPGPAAPQVPFGTGSEPPSLDSLAISSKKEKVKTKGQAHVAEELPSVKTSVAAAKGATPSRPHFNVKKRAFKVFSTLFFNRDLAADQPGEIAWNDFLYALTSVGFMAEKSYGSVWRFTPGKTASDAFQTDQAINCHEPHPVGKIAFYKARMIGRRLNRTYGLEAQDFALEQ